ncbi:MAG TPA: hypothetical protein VFX53_03300 [Pedococcus sp.]|nr:hypothetical protein [Pedococcus sp.]
MNTPSTAVSPGIWGFIAFFVLAIALWLLMRNMNARMRRMSYRAQQRQEEAEAEAAGRLAQEDDGPVAGEQQPGAGPETGQGPGGPGAPGAPGASGAPGARPRQR